MNTQKHLSTWVLCFAVVIFGSSYEAWAQLQLPSIGQGNSGANGFQQSGELSTNVSNASGTFVGADSSDVSNFRSMSALGGLGMGNMGMGSMGMMGLGGMGMMGRGGFGMGGMGMGGRGGMGQMGANNDPRSQLRIPMRIGFARPAMDYSKVASTIQNRLTKIPTLAQANNVNVALNEGLVTLSGTVRSERDRLIIERLMKLEPGVRTVQNDLTVSE